MTFPLASTALNHITVLDLTRVRSGPTCVRQLADWGANVIKVEMPEHMLDGDPMGGPRDSSDFMNLHRNKRSLALNLKAPEGIAVLKRLAAKADNQDSRGADDRTSASTTSWTKKPRLRAASRCLRYCGAPRLASVASSTLAK